MTLPARMALPMRITLPARSVLYARMPLPVCRGPPSTGSLPASTRRSFASSAGASAHQHLRRAARGRRHDAAHAHDAARAHHAARAQRAVRAHAAAGLPGAPFHRVLPGQHPAQLCQLSGCLSGPAPRSCGSRAAT